MTSHQGLKSEMEAKGRSVAACLELGRSLGLGQGPAAEEVTLGTLWGQWWRQRGGGVGGEVGGGGQWGRRGHRWGGGIGVEMSGMGTVGTVVGW